MQRSLPELYADGLSLGSRAVDLQASQQWTLSLNAYTESLSCFIEAKAREKEEQSKTLARFCAGATEQEEQTQRQKRIAMLDSQIDRFMGLAETVRARLVDSRTHKQNTSEPSAGSPDSESLLSQASSSHGQQQDSVSLVSDAVRFSTVNDSTQSDPSPLAMAAFLLQQAEEAECSPGEAVKLYARAGQMFFLAARDAESASNGSAASVQHVADLKRQVALCVDRGETLKMTDGSGCAAIASRGQGLHIQHTPPAISSFATAERGNAAVPKTPSNSPMRPPSNAPGTTLTPAEIAVLRSTSTIAGQTFLPWTAADGRFPPDSDETLFEDPAGLLSLSTKQIQQLSGWARPSQILRRIRARGPPSIISLVSAYSVTQTLVSDCSFVASLAVAAQYERKFSKRLITSKIFPQDSNGQPLFNPQGKYRVKLYANGCWRMVEIDDRLPVSADGRILASFSNNRTEFWVSILEKAFLKLAGGYDFPGSTSEIDLMTLTGWLPEALHAADIHFDETREFSRMLSASKYGDCLVTVSTKNDLPPEIEKTLGLVPGHAYAVLDVREICGHKLLMLKNPWAHLRWKGMWSSSDTRSWTHEMQQLLKYDISTQHNVDNGCFWISWKDILQYFPNIHLSWNPELFAQRYSMHGQQLRLDERLTSSDQASMRDAEQIQVRIDTRRINSDRPSSVWVLLSRHVLGLRDESESAADDQFITTHIYDQTAPLAQRATTSDGRLRTAISPHVKGVYTNSPHSLLRFDVPAHELCSRIIVVSQLEPSLPGARRLKWSLRIHSTAAFQTLVVPSRWTFEQRLRGQWTRAFSGGCANHATFMKNPRFELFSKMDKEFKEQRFLVELVAPTVGHSIGISILADDENVISESGDYLKGYTWCELRRPMHTTQSRFWVVPSTFQPSQLGEFMLVVSSNGPFSFKASR